jgi:hypothetical protein
MVSAIDIGNGFTSKDMAIPYLAIGQKTGTLCDGHPDWIGQFVYDKTYPLGNKIDVVFFDMKKGYEEDLEYGDTNIPQRWDTAEAARSSGLAFRETATLDMLVARSTTDDSGIDFSMIQHGGKGYWPARWVVRSSAYGATAKILARDKGIGWLKGVLCSGFYTVATDKRTNKGNSFFVPVLKASGRVPEDLVNEIRQKCSV